MAEGDGAPVGINAGSVKLCLLDDGQRLRGEGFVEFDDRDVIEREDMTTVAAAPSLIGELFPAVTVPLA